MKKLLITGASGFVGSFLVEEALNRGFDVYAGVRGTSSRKYLPDSRIKFFPLNFSDQNNIEENLSKFAQKGGQGFDYIIHAAGVTKANSLKEYYDVNYQNTIHLVEALIKTNTVPSKFIEISSIASYGPGNPDTLEPIHSEHTPHPVSSYGKSKLMVEDYLKTLIDFPYLVFRPTTVYGPREKDLYTVFKMVNSGFEFYIGTKPQYLSFVYIKDAVDILLDSLPSPITQKAYFISDGNVYKSSELNNLIKSKLKKKTIKLHVPIGVVKGLAFTLEKSFGLFGKIPTLNSERVKEFENTNWTCYVEDLMKDFNFKPQYNLERGVSETVDWYKKEGWL
jgi:nucleoside-diphosphate-sugar epimerase